MEAKRSVDHGARRDSESPVPAPPSPPAYSSSFSEPQTSPSPSSHDKRRKRRSRSRSSSARSKRSRSKERSRKHSRRDRSRSRGRSRSKERRRSRSRNKSRDRHRHGRRHHRQPSYESDLPHDEVVPVGQPLASQPNAFKNDGSFMEMFKKMQGAQSQNPAAATSSTQSISQGHILQEKTVAPPPLMVGKRRGGRILKTGMVAKPKTEVTADQPKDAWSIYMAEVKKYREVCCQEEDNTRPLVK